MIIIPTLCVGGPGLILGWVGDAEHVSINNRLVPLYQGVKMVPEDVERTGLSMPALCGM